MNYGEIKELLNAGFTADEIREIMNSDNTQNSQVFPQAEKPNTTPEPANNDSENTENSAGDQAAAGQDPAGAPAENSNIAGIDTLNQNITKLIKTIQSSNLRNTSFGKTEPDIDKQVDNIMASLIRPEHKTNGGNV